MLKQILAALCLFICIAPARAEEQGPDCFSLSECLSILTDYKIEPPPAPDAYRSSGIDARNIDRAVARLVSFGDNAIVALISLLDHPNYYVENRAAYALFHFSKIDPRHLPALIAAHKRGVSWLAPAIAATGTDEALAFLWADFIEDPDSGSNTQTIRVLPGFGERVLPNLRAELERCLTSDNEDLCDAVIWMTLRMNPAPDFAIPMIESIAKSQSASEAVRSRAVKALVSKRHPYGLVVLRQDLETAIKENSLAAPSDKLFQEFQTDEDAEKFYRFDIERTLSAIATYGHDARETGPLIATLLARRDLPDIRAEAALAIGQVGYREGAIALLDQQGEFTDDWYFAYNAAESLGRLQAVEARGALQEMAHSHWYKPVRNNAERALSFLEGGEFARPDATGDGDPPQDDRILGSYGHFRYHGDESAAGRACPSVHARRYSQFKPRILNWPTAAEEIVSLELAEPSRIDASQILRTYPDLRKTGFPRVPGLLEFAIEFGGRTIIGTNGGEFGGGVYSARRGGRPELLIPDNAIAAFKTPNRLFIVTGLAHLLSHGELWVIEKSRGALVLRRRIPLPQKPDGLALAFPETLIIRSETGDAAIRSNGTLIDPTAVGGCIAPVN